MFLLKTIKSRDTLNTLIYKLDVRRRVVRLIMLHLSYPSLVYLYKFYAWTSVIDSNFISSSSHAIRWQYPRIVSAITYRMTQWQSSYQVTRENLQHWVTLSNLSNSIQLICTLIQIFQGFQILRVYSIASRNQHLIQFEKLVIDIRRKMV